MRTAKAVGMEMLFEPGHTGVGIKQSQNWKIHIHQYTKFALLVLLSLVFTRTQQNPVWQHVEPARSPRQTVAGRLSARAASAHCETWLSNWIACCRSRWRSGSSAWSPGRRSAMHAGAAAIVSVPA